MRRIAGMTPCWNEEATIVFTIASLLPYVNYYVLVDSGSDDLTLPLVRHFFADKIKEGKLHILEYGRPDNFDISKPKNAAIDLIRAADCEYFIRLDGDDVFYRDGAQQAVKIAWELENNVTMFCINHWELYQYRHQTTLDWCKAIGADIRGHKDPEAPNFMCMRIPPGNNPNHPNPHDGSYGHARIYRTYGALSCGKWTDEANGMPGEDIHHPRSPRKCIGDKSEWIVHYGWARPMAKKLAKGRVWFGEGKEKEDIRVDKIHEEWVYLKKYNLSNQDYGDHCFPHRIVFPFNAHPEVVVENIDKVAEFINENQHSNS